MTLTVNRFVNFQDFQKLKISQMLLMRILVNIRFGVTLTLLACLYQGSFANLRCLKQH